MRVRTKSFAKWIVLHHTGLGRKARVVMSPYEAVLSLPYCLTRASILTATTQTVRALKTRFRTTGFAYIRARTTLALPVHGASSKARPKPNAPSLVDFCA